MTGYFQGSAEEKPLLHTWSLAVEEQFYLIVPLLLWGCYRMRFFKIGQRLLLIAGLLLVASLVASCYGMWWRPSATFYLLPTRAWELLCGVTLAMLPTKWLPRKSVWNDALSFVGLAGVLLPCLYYNKDTRFPGFAALPPCLGTALIVWTNARAQAEAPAATLLGRILALRPIVFVGLISYSLYLWHWPLMSFSRYWMFNELSIAYRIGVVAAAFLMAVLSWKLVEQPFRRRRLCSSRKSILVFAGGGLATLFTLGLVARAFAYSPARVSSEVRACALAYSDRGRFGFDLSVKDAEEGRLVTFGGTNQSSQAQLLVWGDSHAMMILTALDALGQETGVGGVAAVHSATAPLLGYAYQSGFGLREPEALAFGNAVLNYVTEHKIPKVLLAAMWSNYLMDECSVIPDPESAVRVKQALLRTIAELRNAGASVWILEEIPRHHANVPRVVARQCIFGVDAHKCAADVESHRNRSNPFNAFRAQLVDAGAELIDLSPLLLDPDGNHYLMVNGEDILFRDNNHLTKTGALFVRRGLTCIFEAGSRLSASSNAFSPAGTISSTQRDRNNSRPSAVTDISSHDARTPDLIP